MLRLASHISLALMGLALLAWSASYFFPTPAKLIFSRVDGAVFFNSQFGTLVLWTQEVSPPPPSSCTVRLNTPYRFQILAVGSGGGRSLFFSRYAGGFESGDLFWEKIRGGAGVLYTGTTAYTFQMHVRKLIVGWRLVIAICAIVPALRATKSLIERRRASQGRCAVCGYDLRATPDRCPECGSTSKPTTGASRAV